MIRSAIRGLAALALAILMSSAVAASAAADDLDQTVTFHIGVRTVAVGEPIPVTVVGAEPGSTWEVRERSTDTALGILAVGEDGTATATVSLPLDTKPGSTELVAVSGDVELSSAASVGSSVAHEVAVVAEAEAPGAFPVVPVAAAATAVLIALAVLLLIRTRRGATRRTSKEIAS